MNFKILDRSFSLGFFTGFWPSMFFFFLAIAQVLEIAGTQKVIEFYDKLNFLPILFIFYEGILFLAAGVTRIYFPEKRFPKGVIYGALTTLALVVLLGVVFSTLGL